MGPRLPVFARTGPTRPPGQRLTLNRDAGSILKASLRIQNSTIAFRAVCYPEGNTIEVSGPQWQTHSAYPEARSSDLDRPEHQLIRVGEADVPHRGIQA